jgi:hypothetical protein
MWIRQYTGEDVVFDQFPPLPEGEFYHKWLNDYGLLDSLYHEYFHHYQKAHTLDRVMGFDNADFDSPEQNVNAPWWWIEGAGQFASWYARDHWKEIEHLAYLNPNDPAYDGYWEQLDWDIGAPNSGNGYSSLDDHIDFSITNLNASFFFAASQVQDTPNKKNGLLNAGVPDDQSCEGWEASPEDGWYSGDYRRSYAGQNDCTFIIFAAGTQFIAYKSSWQVALRDIPADYYQLGFWGSIEKHLGLTELDFYTEFNALLRSVDANTIDEAFAPPGWKIPEQDIAEVVNFNDISYYGKVEDVSPQTTFIRLLDSILGLLTSTSPTAASIESADSGSASAGHQTDEIMREDNGNSRPHNVNARTVAGRSPHGIPSHPLFALFILSGLMALFGIRRLRAISM